MLINYNKEIYQYQYKGIFDEEYIIGLVELIQNEFEPFVNKKTIKIINFCAIELAQNIGHYSISKHISGKNGKEYGCGTIKIALYQDFVEFEASNLVNISQKEKINEKVSFYNLLPANELKQFFKNKIRAESEEDSKGGGIGFIEIIRKTNNPIALKFDKLENDIFNMHIKLLINNGEQNG